MALTVTTIITAFNSAKYLREAIDSALCDRSPQVESDVMVVVDEGSTDSTADIVRSYGHQVRPLYISHVESVGAARNRGISAATAKYVALLDDDDLSLPGRVQRQVQLIEAASADLVVGDGLEFEDGSEARNSFMERTHLKDSLQRHLRNNVLLNAARTILELRGLAPPSTILARRESLLAVGGFAENLYCEDFDLYVRMATTGRIAVELSPVILRRLHSQNASKRRMRMASDGIVVCERLRKLEQISADSKSLEYVDRMDAQWRREQGAIHLETGDRSAARRSWAASYRLNPSLRIAAYFGITFLPSAWTAYLRKLKTEIRSRLSS